MLKHILVVHESMTVSTIINNYVMSELSNVSITECDSPIQSLEELDDTCFDVVFSGCAMPEMDGFGLIKHIRQSALNAETPVVLITSGNVTEEVSSRLQNPESESLIYKNCCNHLILR